MRVLVTGATGFIGSAVVQELLQAGHEVIGLARSDAAAARLKAAGAQVHRGSLEDPDSLRRGAAAADGVIHTAFFHEIAHMAWGTRLRILLGGKPSGIGLRFIQSAVAADRQAIETLGQALKGPDRALVAVFGTMALQPGQLASEVDAYAPSAVGAGRGASENTVQALAASGVRASVIRLPPLVHGAGDRGGFAPRLIQLAQKKASSAYVGDGSNRWPAVHRLDAARLLRLALEKGASGARYHGVAETGIPFRQIAELIGERSLVPVSSVPLETADKHFGWLGLFTGVDNPTSSQWTQDQLTWKPTEPGFLANLAGKDYFGK